MSWKPCLQLQAMAPSRGRNGAKPCRGGGRGNSAVGVGQKRPGQERGGSANGVGADAEQSASKKVRGEDALWSVSGTRWAFEPQVSHDDLKQIFTYLLTKKGRTIANIEMSAAGLVFTMNEEIRLKVLWTFLNYHSNYNAFSSHRQTKYR